MKKTENADNLSSVTAELKKLREKAGVKKGNKFTKAGIFDEVDKTQSISGQIEQSGVADIAISDTLGTLGEIGDELKRPDITPSERKNLMPLLKVAREQLKTSDGAEFEGDLKKDYDEAKKKIEKRLDVFENMIKKGDGKGLGSQVGGALAGKAGGFLVGLITQNPMMSMAYDALSGHLGKKSDNKKMAKQKLADTHRAQITKLEEKRTAMSDGKKPKASASPKTPNISTFAQQAYDEQEGNVTPEKPSSAPASSPTAIPQRAEGGSTGDSSLIHDDLQELITVNQSMVEVLKNIEEDSDKRRVLAEKANKKSDELRLEADRKNKGGMLDKGKDKLKDMKKGIVDVFKGLASVLFKIIAFGTMILPWLKQIGKAFKGVFKVFTKIFAIPLAIIGGLVEAVQSWGDSEGKELPERILQSMIDFVSGAISALTFGLLDAEIIKKAFKDTGRMMYEFLDEVWQWVKDAIWNLIPAPVRTAAKVATGMFGSTDDAKTQEANISNNSKAFSQDRWDDEIHIKDEAEMKKVDFPTLRSIMGSPDATEDTKTMIRKYLIDEGQLVRPKSGATVATPTGQPASVATPTTNTTKSSTEQAMLSQNSSNEKSETMLPPANVVVDNSVKNTSPSGSGHGQPLIIPDTSDVGATSRLSGNLA